MVNTGGGSPVPHGVLVGLDDMYALMLAIQNKQSEMNGQIGAFMAATNTANEIMSRELNRVDAEHKDDHRDHETRLRIIELRPTVSPKAVWAAIGVLIPLTGVVVAIVSLATR